MLGLDKRSNQKISLGFNNRRKHQPEKQHLPKNFFNANLQETLLLSTNHKPSKAQEREQKDEGEMKNGRLIYSDLRRN